MKIHCLVCGKEVCPIELPEGTIIRAWIECPECAGGEKGSYIEGAEIDLEPLHRTSAYLIEGRSR